MISSCQHFLPVPDDQLHVVHQVPHVDPTPLWNRSSSNSAQVALEASVDPLDGTVQNFLRINSRSFWREQTTSFQTHDNGVEQPREPEISDTKNYW